MYALSSTQYWGKDDYRNVRFVDRQKQVSICAYQYYNLNPVITHVFSIIYSSYLQVYAVFSTDSDNIS